MKLTNKKYFLSFIEEFWPGQVVAHLGRVEVYDKTSKYAKEEIRFAFNDTKEYWKVREEWDFKNVTKEKLSKLKRILKKYMKKAENSVKISSKDGEKKDRKNRKKGR